MLAKQMCYYISIYALLVIFVGESSFVIYKTAFNDRGIEKLFLSLVFPVSNFERLFKCLFADANTNLRNMN